MPSTYINLGLRVFFGTIAGALKIPPFVVGAWMKGIEVPTYNLDAAVQLGAPLLRHVSGDGSSGSGVTKDQFVDVTITTKDGVKLHAVVDAGLRRKKGKRPIVFVHGFPELWVSWHEQLEHFAAAGHPVIAMDMRGYGMSDQPKGIENYHVTDHLVEDIRAVVAYATTELGGGKAKPLLCAHDWGAGICWPYVCQQSTVANQEVSGYASLAIPPTAAFVENMSLRQVWASLYMIFFNMPWLPEKIFLAGNAWLVAAIMKDCKRAKLPQWLVNTYRANVLQPGAMEAQFNYYRSSIQNGPKPNEDDYGTKKKPLPLPTLIIRGMDDSALGDDIFKCLDKYLEDNKLVELEDCSHWIQADCPNEVNREIEVFLGKLA